MQILLVCSEYPPRPHGGIGSFVADLARGLAGRGHRVTVVGWGLEAGEVRDGDVRVVTVAESRLPGIHHLVTRLRLKRRIEAEVAAGRVDVVEAPEYDGPLPWGVRGAPVVLRLHLSRATIDAQAGRRPNWKRTAFERRTLVRNRSWIGVSRHVIDLTRRTFGLEPDRSAVVYNPVEPAQPGAPVSAPEAPYLLFAGTVSERKGAVALAQAARLVLPRFPALRLVFAGKPLRTGGVPAPDAIRAALGPFADRAVFTGFLPRAEVRAAMRRAEAFVFMSQLEAQGIVLLEALAEGCPVIASDGPPFTEFLRDGETALLAPPREPPAIAAAIERLMHDPGLRERLAEAGPRTAAEFSPGRTIDGTLAFYEQVLAGRGAPAPLRPAG